MSTQSSTGSARYAVNLSMLFTELPLLERPAAAKAAGFDAVDFWWPFASAVPADAEVDGFVDAVQGAGVQLIGLNFFAGDMPGGDRGLVSWPARSAEFADNVDVVVGIGDRLGCKAFNALYGNRTDESTPVAQDEIATENLALAARAVARIGGVVLVEPVSGAPRYPLLTAADVIRVIDRVEAPLIAMALNACGGNQIQAADVLGLNRNTLRKKIRTHSIEIVKHSRRNG